MAIDSKKTKQKQNNTKNQNKVISQKRWRQSLF